MNKAILQGNVGKTPDINILPSGKKVAKFSLATRSYRKDSEGNNISEWHNIICWEKLADLVEKYVSKGSKLIIIGEIQYRNYENKEGQKVYMTEIICRELELLDKKPESKPLENNEGKFQNGKSEVGSMSNIDDLPGANDIKDPPF